MSASRTPKKAQLSKIGKEKKYSTSEENKNEEMKKKPFPGTQQFHDFVNVIAPSAPGEYDDFLRGIDLLYDSKIEEGINLLFPYLSIDFPLEFLDWYLKQRSLGHHTIALENFKTWLEGKLNIKKPENIDLILENCFYLFHKIAFVYEIRVDAFYLSGQYCLATKQFLKAIPILTESISQHPEDAMFYKNRGICHFELKNYALAEIDFRKALELQPGDQSITKELQKIKIALSDDKSNVIENINQAKFYSDCDEKPEYYIGFTKGAMEEFVTKYVKTGNEQLDIAFHEGVALLKQKNYKQAYVKLTIAKKIAKKNISDPVYKKTYAKICALFADIFYHESSDEKYNKIVSALSLAIKNLDINCINNKILLTTYYVTRARANIKLKKDDDVRADYKQAILLSPRNSPFLKKLENEYLRYLQEFTRAKIDITFGKLFPPDEQKALKIHSEIKEENSESNRKDNKHEVKEKQSHKVTQPAEDKEIKVLKENKFIHPQKNNNPVVTFKKMQRYDNCVVILGGETLRFDTFKNYQKALKLNLKNSMQLLTSLNAKKIHVMWMSYSPVESKKYQVNRQQINSTPVTSQILDYLHAHQDVDKNALNANELDLLSRITGQDNQTIKWNNQEFTFYTNPATITSIVSRLRKEKSLTHIFNVAVGGMVVRSSNINTAFGIFSIYQNKITAISLKHESQFFIPLLSDDDKGEVQIYLNSQHGDKFANGFDLHNIKVLSLVQGQTELASSKQIQALINVLRQEFNVVNGSYIDPLSIQLQNEESDNDEDNDTENNIVPDENEKKGTTESLELTSTSKLTKEVEEESESSDSSSESEDELFQDTPETFDLLPPSAFDVKKIAETRISDANKIKYKELLNGISLLQSNNIVEGCQVIFKLLALPHELIRYYSDTFVQQDQTAHKTALKNLSAYIEDKLLTAIESKEISYGNEIGIFCLILSAISLTENYKSIAYYYHGIYYLLDKNYEASMLALNESIHCNPEESHGFFFRALLKIKLEQYQLAAQDLEEALRLKPNDLNAREQLRILKEKTTKQSGIVVKTLIDNVKIKFNVDNFSVTSPIDSGIEEVDKAYNNAKLARDGDKKYNQYELLKFAKTTLETHSFEDLRIKYAYSQVCFAIAEYYDNFKKRPGYIAAAKFWGKALDNAPLNSKYARSILIRRALTYLNLKERANSKSDYVKAISDSPADSLERKAYAHAYHQYIRHFNESEKEEFLKLTNHAEEFRALFPEEKKQASIIPQSKNQAKIIKGIELIRQNNTKSNEEALKLFGRMPAYKVNTSFISVEILDDAFNKLTNFLLEKLGALNGYMTNSDVIPESDLAEIDKLHKYADLLRKIMPNHTPYAYYLDGLFHLLKRENDKCIEFCTRAIEKEKDGLYFFARAQAYNNLLHLDEALEDVNKAIEINEHPGITDGMERLKSIILQQKHPESSASDEKPGKVSLSTMQFIKGLKLLSERNIDEGVELILNSKKTMDSCKDIAINPSTLRLAKTYLHASVRNLVDKLRMEVFNGVTEIHLSEFEKLGQQNSVLEKIAHESEYLSIVYFVKCFQCILMSQMKDALQHIIVSIQYRTTPENLTMRAKLYLDDNNYDDAYRDYLTIIKMVPYHEEAKKGIEKIMVARLKDHKHALKVSKPTEPPKQKMPVSKEAHELKMEFDELKTTIKTHIESVDLTKLSDSLNRLNQILHICNVTNQSKGSDSEFLTTSITKAFIRISGSYVEAVKKLEEKNSKVAVSVCDVFIALSNAESQIIAQFRNRKKVILSNSKKDKIKSIQDLFVEVENRIEKMPRFSKIEENIKTLITNQSLSVEDAKYVIQSTKKILKHYSTEDLSYLKEKLERMNSPDMNLPEVKKGRKEKINRMQKMIDKYEKIHLLHDEILKEKTKELASLYNHTLQNIRTINKNMKEVEGLMSQSEVGIKSLTRVSAITSMHDEIIQNYEEKMSSIIKLVSQVKKSKDILDSTRSVISVGKKNALQPINTYDNTILKLSQSFIQFKENVSILIDKVEREAQLKIQKEQKKEKTALLEKQKRIEEERLALEEEKFDHTSQDLINVITQNQQEILKTLESKNTDLFLKNAKQFVDQLQLLDEKDSKVVASFKALQEFFVAEKQCMDSVISEILTKFATVKQIFQPDNISPKFNNEIAELEARNVLIQQKIDTFNQSMHVIYQNFDHAQEELAQKIEIYTNHLKEEALHLSTLPFNSDPHETRTYQSLIDSIDALKNIYSSIHYKLEVQKDFLDSESLEKLKIAAETCDRKIKTRIEMQKILLDKLGTEAQLMKKLELMKNYTTIFRGGDSQYPGFLCYSELKYCASVTINDMDGFIDTENPKQLKMSFLLKDALNNRKISLLPSINTMKIPGQLYITQHNAKAPLRYYVYGEAQDSPILHGKIPYSELSFSVDNIDNIDSYLEHADEIIEKIIPTVPNISTYEKFSFWIDNREIDLTLKNPKTYKGNEFVTGLMCGETIISKVPVDAKNYDCIQIKESLYLGINKNAPYHQEYKESITDKTYLVASYVAGLHQRHSFLVIKNLKKMRQWFGSELRLDDKPKIASDGKTIIMGYNLFLQQLSSQFRTHIIDFPGNEFSSYQEINTVVKYLPKPFEDPDIQPYLKALVDAVVLRENRARNEEITGKVLKELKQYYTLFPKELKFETKLMKYKFETIIKKCVKEDQLFKKIRVSEQSHFSTSMLERKLPTNYPHSELTRFTPIPVEKKSSSLTMYLPTPPAPVDYKKPRVPKPGYQKNVPVRTLQNWPSHGKKQSPTKEQTTTQQIFKRK